MRKDDHRRVAIKAIDRKVTRPLPTSGAGSDVLNEVRERRLAMWPGVAQEGGGGGYHCSGAAGHPKLASTLEIPALEQIGV